MVRSSSPIMKVPVSGVASSRRMGAGREEAMVAKRCKIECPVEKNKGLGM